MPLPLHPWENFYVIVGSAAAALTGLQFVVMALGADLRAVSGADEAVDAFATPTVVHFSVVLLIATIVSIPGHTAISLSLCVGITGAAGLAYSVAVIRRARRQKSYAPVFEDWLWHAGLPFLAYLALLASGVTAARRPGSALFVTAAGALLLLGVGIHNAWDAAVYMSSRKGAAANTLRQD